MNDVQQKEVHKLRNIHVHVHECIVHVHKHVTLILEGANIVSFPDPTMYQGWGLGTRLDCVYTRIYTSGPCIYNV